MKFNFLCLLIFSGGILFAQNEPVPQDSSIRSGKLKNGLSYFIKANKHHKGHADFQIFHAVGALQEEDNQNGLAHFLEHQAFKGLKRFPGKTMVNYLQELGVKFGTNLNAATTKDYTRYLMNGVPVMRQGTIDSCLMILADWSGSILASQEDIDTERGVIKEEWRTRTGAEIRTHDAMAPFYFKGSKYAERSVIGDMQIIENFKRKELLNFYHKWYRPDLQAVSIVGDVDPVELEKDLIREFSKIKAVKKPSPLEKFTIPSNKDLIYGTYSDKEATNTSISLLYKHKAPAKDVKGTKSGYATDYLTYVITWMMNNRWNEISANKDFALKSLYYNYGNLAGDVDVFGISGSVKNGRDYLLPAMDTLLMETERFKRFGFTNEELNLAKVHFSGQLERKYADREKRTNGSYMESFFAHFIDNEPIVSSEDSYHILKQVIDTVSMAYLNNRMLEFFGEENRIVSIITSEEEAEIIPSKNFIEDKLNQVSSLVINPYKGYGIPLLDPTVQPSPGKVVAEKQVLFGATLWELSNGAKVYLLPTTHKKDEILFEAFNTGGHSVLSDKDFYSGRLVSSAITNSGAGSLNTTELSRALTGKVVYVTPYFSEFYEGFSGATTPKDLESALKLMYLYFKEPRFNEMDYNLSIKNIKENLATRKNNPFAALQDSVFLVRSNYHLRASNVILDPKEADLADFDRIQEIYKEAFANPGDFTYVFTGSIDLESVKPIIEKYIGGLEGIHRKDSWRDVGKRSPLGEVSIDFKNKMETPKSTVFMEYTQLVPYSIRKASIAQVLQGVLENRLNTVLRDENSGVYTPAIEAGLRELPTGQLNLIISFDTKPDLVDHLLLTVKRELEKMSEKEINKEEIAKSKEYLLKSYNQGFTTNNYWQYILMNFSKTGRDQNTGFIDMLKSISETELRNLLADLVRAENIVSVIMRPE